MSDPIAMPPNADWRMTLDDRTRTHVEFATRYARDFHHGAPGHLDLMTIATLADLIDLLNRRREEDAR